jgi:TetR/AcrR family transcriptional regulator
MGILERKEREKERRKEEILDAAQRIFFEKGLVASTMDEIAAAAELSKATLYLHFVSKEDLYLAVAMRGLRLIRSMFKEILEAGLSLVDTLDRLSLSYRDFFYNQREYFRMLGFLQNPQFHKQVSEPMMIACNEESDRIREIILSLIGRGAQENKIRSDLSPTEMAVVILSNATSLMLRVDSEGECWKKRLQIDPDKIVDMSMTLTIDAILTPEARLEYEETRSRRMNTSKNS